MPYNPRKPSSLILIKNKKGQFNVPFGRYHNPLICDADKLRMASYALRNAELHCSNYRETLETYAKPGDFVYIDPPYHPISQYSDFKRYTAEFFYADDQRALAQTVRKLAEQGCSVVVSNSHCDFIFDIYDGLLSPPTKFTTLVGPLTSKLL